MTALSRIYENCSEQSRSSQVSGFLFERYELQSLLGFGGTSLVASAHDHRLNRKVAVKIWNPRGITFVSRQTRRFSRVFFLREAELLAALTHPNLCEIYDFGVSEDKIPWMVMEFFAAETLGDLLQSWRVRRAEHDLSTIITIFRQVVACVRFLHSRQLWRLDVKPDNVLVNGLIAKVIDVGSCIGSQRAASDTRTVACGTVGYLAPEMFVTTQPEELTPSADVFSLGIMLLEMCCLDNPLDSEEIKRAAYDALGIRHPIGGDAGSSIVRSDGLDAGDRAARHARTLADVDFAAIVCSASIPPPRSIIDLITRMTAGKPDHRPDAQTIFDSLLRIETTLTPAANQNSLACRSPRGRRTSAPPTQR